MNDSDLFEEEDALESLAQLDENDYRTYYSINIQQVIDSKKVKK